MNVEALVANNVQLTGQTDGSFTYSVNLLLVDLTNEQLQAVLSSIDIETNKVVLTLHTEKTKA